MSDEFSNDSKAVDRNRPFHRINTDSFAPSRKRASGNGKPCGCREKEDFDDSAIFSIPIIGIIPRLAAQELMKVLPSWVSIERESQPNRNLWPALEGVEREVEGRLKFSQQTHEDFPFSQWHWWYDWNFFVVPAHGYRYVRAEGTRDDMDDLIRGGAIECEWDTGAFGAYDFDRPGGRVPTLDEPGPMFGRDWAWPVGGEYIWIAGKWIYDCGHAEEHGGKASSELHPCKAIATARWEAVEFDENERHVPAIQFMFFANSTGGYCRVPGLGEKDYEFIVDLPEPPAGLAETPEYPIGRSPDFPLNTLALRPRLLTKLDREPFGNARGPVAEPGEADPLIELMPAENPGELPKQVRVRFPLTDLGAAAPESYGVIVSLGWHDPLRSEADKIKEVRIFFDTVVLGDLEHTEEFLEPEMSLQFKFGVNGRWHAKHFVDVPSRARELGLKRLVTLHLHERDDIRIASCGMEEDVSGRTLRIPFDNRTVKGAGGIPFDYRNDFDQPDHGHVSRIAHQMAIEGVGDFAASFFQDWPAEISDPLGRIVPGVRAGRGDTPNPLTLRELMERTGGPGRPLEGRLTARVSLGQHTMSASDYTLRYQIEYRDLPN